MPDHDHIPIHFAPDPKPVKRHQHHHTARYFAHRVHNSLTTRLSKLVCATFLSLLAILGLITFILWLSLRPHRPRIHIHGFSVPGLGQESGFENARISFRVAVRNANQNIGIYYEDMNGSVYYRDQKIGSTPLQFPSYQGPKNTTAVDGVLSGATLTVSSQRWTEFLSDKAEGRVVFRLDLTALTRFKISSWESKRQRIHAQCDVALRPKSPSYSIAYISIPQSGQNGSSIVYSIEIENPNKDSSIYFDDIVLSFLYGNDKVGESNIGSFHEGTGKTHNFLQTVEANHGAFKPIANAISNATAELKVALMTRFRYKTWGIKSKFHGVNLQGTLPIGSDGKLAGKKKKYPIKNPSKKSLLRAKARRH
ncbi:NDR1/HIN1-like protein 26 [Senna tora]|uniref:NDR1/HIN1-like protein 26 n=1 Tax=Senna tora TaxID=362788 RepID=A0A834XBS8_9FABA|nr:NDR1/HIN1-like protein 26 [Senna tora]